MNSKLKAFAKSQAATSLTIMGLRGTTMVAKFILALFITRFMGLEAMGVYGLIAGATIVLPVVFALGLQNTLSREAVGQDEAELTHNLVQYWALMTGLYGVALALGSIWGVMSGHAGLLLTVVGIALLEHINQDIFVFMISLHKPLLGNVLNFIRVTVWIFAFMAAAWLGWVPRDMSHLLVFWGVGLVVPLVVFGAMVRHWPWKEAFLRGVSWVWVVQHVKKARMLFLSDLAFSAGQYTDRFLISLFLGLELTGVYVFFWQIGNAMYNLTSTGVLQLYRPRLIHAFNKKDEPLFWKLLKDSFRKTLFSAAGLACVTGGAALVLLPHLHKPLAEAHVSLMGFILATLVVRLGAEAIGMALPARRKDKEHAAILWGTLGLSVGLNLLLLGAGTGLAGAIVAGVLATAFVLGVRIYIVRAIWQNTR